MPIACRAKAVHGPQFCTTDCPATAPCGVFAYVRVAAPEDLPPYDPLAVDVAVLDMNHGWPNLGHDSLVHAVLDAGCDLLEPLLGTGLRVRVLSFDVRRSRLLPEPPGGRFALYLGTGGPGHIEPERNDGVADWSQGIHEDPAWREPFFRLLDAIRDDQEAALLAVCHTFGLLCLWSGAAVPVLRGPEKGGKSAGILENVLTPEARAHPWFGRFARELPDGRRFRILDNRLFDLIPAEPLPGGFVALGREASNGNGAPAGSLTMLEIARDAAGVLPRILGVNHHPEIVDRERQRMILDQMRARGEVSDAWYNERMEALTRAYPDEDSDRRLHLTSDFTLLGPLRFHLHRQIRRRAESLGLRVGLHEDEVVEALAEPAALA